MAVVFAALLVHLDVVASGLCQGLAPRQLALGCCSSSSASCLFALFSQGDQRLAGAVRALGWRRRAPWPHRPPRRPEPSWRPPYGPGRHAPLRLPPGGAPRRAWCAPAPPLRPVSPRLRGVAARLHGSGVVFVILGGVLGGVARLFGRVRELARALGGGRRPCPRPSRWRRRSCLRTWPPRQPRQRREDRPAVSMAKPRPAMSVMEPPLRSRSTP